MRAQLVRKLNRHVSGEHFPRKLATIPTGQTFTDYLHTISGFEKFTHGIQPKTFYGYEVNIATKQVNQFRGNIVEVIQKLNIAHSINDESRTHFQFLVDLISEEITTINFATKDIQKFIGDNIHHIKNDITSLEFDTLT